MPQTLSTAAPTARLLGTGTRARSLSSTTLTSGLALIVIAFIAWRTAGSIGIGFSSVGFANIGQVLAPAVLISLFIERAAEVVITSWRSPEVQRLQHEIDVATNDAQLQAQRVLDFYRLETQRIAFVLSFSLAVIAALVGVRVIEPLLDPGAMNAVRRDHLAQWSWLRNLDILLTGLLMAGGADGIHRIITTFTAFLDSTRDRISASVSSGGPQPQPASAPQPAAPVQQHPAPVTQAPAAPQAVPALSPDYDDGV